MLREFFGTNRRAFMVVVAAIGVAVMWGCQNSSSGGDHAYANSTGDAAAQVEQKTLDNYNSLTNKPAMKPSPQSYSNELVNIRARQQRFGSDPNKISYIYLMAMDGTIVSYYTVKGKVSALDSQNTPPVGCREAYTYDYQCALVDLPQMDGSYGTNGNGIFFFTTNGTYVEWPGWYLLSDRQLTLTTQPKLVVTVPGG